MTWPTGARKSRSWPECVDSAYARTAPSLAAAAPDATMQRHQATSKTCSLQMLFARTLKLRLRLWLHLVRIRSGARFIAPALHRLMLGHKRTGASLTQSHTNRLYAR